MISNILLTLGLSALETTTYLTIFCHIRGSKVTAKLWLVYLGLELLRLLLLDPAVSSWLMVAELFLVGKVFLKDRNKHKSYFYAVYTFFFTFTASNFVVFFFQKILPLSFFNRSLPWLTALSLLGILIYHNWLLKKIGPDTFLIATEQRPSFDRVIRMMNLYLSAAAALAFFCRSSELLLKQEGGLLSFSRQLLLALAVAAVSFLIFLRIKINTYKQAIYQQTAEKENKYLKNYSKEIEHLYQTVKSFKHDYKNLLLCLENGLQTGDLQTVRSLYKDILLKAQLSLNHNACIGELINLRHSALKSLLYWKIGQAQQAGISLKLEIQDKICELALNQLDLIRLMSILMDNAIEAAKEALRPNIHLALIKDGRGHVIYLRNSRKPCPLTVKQVFQPGFSTKGQDRGTGLHTVSRIIDGYSHLASETKITDTHFTQIIYIGEPRL